MLRGDALDPVQRLAPRVRGLAGEAGDQIDIDVADAGFAQHGDLVGDYLRGMLAARAPDLALDERLHSEADAIDPACGPGVREFRSDAAGRGLDGGFGPG